MHEKCHQVLEGPDVEASRLVCLLPWRPLPCPLNFTEDLYWRKVSLCPIQALSFFFFF